MKHALSSKQRHSQRVNFDKYLFNNFHKISELLCFSSLVIFHSFTCLMLRSAPKYLSSYFYNSIIYIYMLKKNLLSCYNQKWIFKVSCISTFSVCFMTLTSEYSALCSPGAAQKRRHTIKGRHPIYAHHKMHITHEVQLTLDK